jgi:hypothetical protein
VLRISSVIEPRTALREAKVDCIIARCVRLVICKLAIFPLVYRLVSGPRGRLPSTGARGRRCGGIIAVMMEGRRRGSRKIAVLMRLGPY